MREERKHVSGYEWDRREHVSGYEWEMSESMSVVMNGRGERACYERERRKGIFATVGIYIKTMYKCRDVSPYMCKCD